MHVRNALDHFSKNKKEYLYLLLLLFLTLPLRFINLEYSDYIGDEFKSFLIPDKGEGIYEFFMTQRKGPLQFIISVLPYFFTQDFRMELPQRIPFAIFSVFSVLVFFYLVKKLTKDVNISATATFLFLVNGFIVGFGRISQYQNLNLFFSFASLYFFLDFLENKKNYLLSSLLGTLMFCLSFFAHWDAIFIIPPVLIILVKFLLNKEIAQKLKVKILILNLVFGSLVILPFMLPFVETQLESPQNIRYLSRRVDVGYVKGELYKTYIELYNPFLVFQFLFITSVLSLFWIKKNWFYFLWFSVNFAFFEIFFRKPGTHIYNFLIPVFILSAWVLVYVFKLLPRYIKYFFVLVIFALFTFFYYQSYVIFVDNKVEYPWERETLLTFLCKKNPKDKKQLKYQACMSFIKNNFETRKFDIEEKLPLFGFPLSRKWNEINKLVLEDMTRHNLVNYGFITNEEKTISQRYMMLDYRSDGGFYVIGIKRPQSFMSDWQFKNIEGKRSIGDIDVNGRNVVKIWRVDKRL